MNVGSKLSALLAASAFAFAACNPQEERGNDRWVTTENTNVPINWDKVNEAYQKAEGPEDFERRVNEIYEGAEVVSVAVQDVDDRTQVVTGFFDRDGDGSVDEDEKVFSITRVITAEGAEVQTQGYGPHYGYYHSPFLSIVTGMMVGSMLSNALRPNYAPMYRQPYTTSAGRAQELRTQRSAFRAQHPERFRGPSSKGTGKKYGGSRPSGGSRPRGGGRFGVRRPAGAPAPVRLTA
jgi:hypothetical protein